MKKVRLLVSLLVLLGSVSACTSITAPDDINPGSNHMQGINPGSNH